MSRAPDPLGPIARPFEWAPPHPDGHLRLVETVLSGLAPRARTGWMKDHLPRTLADLARKRHWEALSDGL